MRELSLIVPVLSVLIFIFYIIEERPRSFFIKYESYVIYIHKLNIHKVIVVLFTWYNCRKLYNASNFLEDCSSPSVYKSQEALEAALKET